MVLLGSLTGGGGGGAHFRLSFRSTAQDTDVWSGWMDAILDHEDKDGALGRMQLEEHWGPREG